MVRSAPEVRAEAEAIGDRIVERRSARGLDVVRAPAPIEPANPGTSLADATLRADEAFATLALGEADRAIDEGLASADAQGIRSRDELLALLLLSAMVRGAQGDEAGADAAAQMVLALDPVLVVDLERYPPTLSARIDRARASVARCPLILRVDPADALLTLDGVPGAPPAELPCGTHWVSASRAGYAPSTRRVVLVPDGDAITMTLAIDPPAALADAGPVGAPIDPLVERGAAALGRALVVLDVREEADGAIVATLEGRRVRVTPGTTPDEVAEALLAPIAVSDDTALWVGVGLGAGAAVAAAIALGVAVALAPSSPPGWVGVGEVVLP